MKRLLFAIIFSGFGLLLATATVFAQGGTAGDGFPPQSAIYADAVLLARALPFVIALAVGFGMWQAKLRGNEKKSAPNSPTVIRHDWGSVISHWTTTGGFLVGLATGFMILRILPYPTDVRLFFALHYIAAGFAVFGAIGHLTQQLILSGNGLLPRKFKDILEALGTLTEYAGLYGPQVAAFRLNIPKGIRTTFAETFRSFGIRPPKQLGKYLPAEKVLSYVPWAIVVGVMTITGLIKALRFIYPIPPTFIATMTTLHDYSAYATVAMLVVHLAALVLVPHHWPLLISMFTSRISRKYVQESLPLWYNQLTAEEQRDNASIPTSTQPAKSKA